MTVTTTTPPMLPVARRYAGLGLSVIPTAHDASKRPLLSTWKEHQTTAATGDQLAGMFGSNVKALAIIGGDVSGGLFVLDFDADADRIFPEFYAGLVKLIPEPLVIRTGGGGRHVYIRCPGNCPNNTKLAHVPDEDKASGQAIAIEIKGEGGYFIAPPSLHYSGNAYEVDEGSFDSIPEVDPDTLAKLIDLAKALDECPLSKQDIAACVSEYKRTSKASRNGSASVIDTFNAAHSPDDFLQANGYSSAGKPGQLYRPGKDRGGASVVVEDGVSVHYSTNDPLNDQRFRGVCGRHDAFDLYCHFNHQGNVRAAVKAAAEALGMKAERKAGKDAEQATPLPTIDDYTPFPVDQLPPVAARFVREAESALQVEAGFVAGPMLAALGAAIGNAAAVILKSGFVQPACLWVAPVAGSGSGKSPGHKAALSSAWRRQIEKLNQHKHDAADYDAALAKYEATPKADRVDSEKPVAPTLEHNIIVDATAEAIAVRLMQSPRGLLCAPEELPAVFKSMNAYKQGGSDQEAWLSFYDAAPAKIDRKTSTIATILLPHAFVALTGGVQPGVLATLLAEEQVDAGLAARFLFLMPPSKRRAWSEDAISDVASEAMIATFDALYSLPLNQTESDVKPAILPLSIDAKRIWAEWFNEVEDEIASTADPESPYAIALPKIRSTAARLALILQLVSHVSGEKQAAGDHVDSTSMARGVALARWFKAEQLRVYAVLGTTKGQRRLARLVAMIRDIGGSVSVRDWQRKRNLKTRADAEGELQAIADANHGAWCYVTPEGGGHSAKTLTLYDTRPVFDPENAASVSHSITSIKGRFSSLSHNPDLGHQTEGGSDNSTPMTDDTRPAGAIKNAASVTRGVSK